MFIDKSKLCTRLGLQINTTSNFDLQSDNLFFNFNNLVFSRYNDIFEFANLEESKWPKGITVQTLYIQNSNKF